MARSRESPLSPPSLRPVMADADGVETAAPAESSDGGLRAGLRERAARVFSPRFFLVALALAAAGLLVGRTVVPLFGGLGGLVGVVAAGALAGLRGGTARYLETGVAGAAAAGAGTLLDYLLLSVAGGIGVPIAAVGLGAGFVAAVLGYYLARDLRAGLTAEL